MFYGACHVGIGVFNMEASLAFYRNILGLKVLHDFSGEDKTMNEVIGRPAEMRVVMLGAIVGGACIKLVQFLPGKYAHKALPVPTNRRWGDVEYCELCFDVWNAETTHNLFVKKGAKPVMEVTKFSALQPDGKELISAYAYLKDPDGALVEFNNHWLDRKEVRGVDKSFDGIIRLDHLGFGVTNMDRSKAFYQDVLGFNKVIYDIEGESAMSKLVGERLNRRLVMLHNENDGAVIELIQPYPPYKARPLSPEARWGDLGVMEMGISVKDIEKHYRTLVKEKVQLMCPVGIVKELGAEHVYIKDPDGLLIELIELPT